MTSDSKTEEGIDRLNNWAAWCRSGETSMIMKHYFPSVSPMFREYRAPWPGDDDGGDRLAIDENDAAMVEKRLKEIPEHLRAVVLWAFLGKRITTVFRVHLMSTDQIRLLVDQAARTI